MIIVISPAKKLDFHSPVKITDKTPPQFSDEASELISVLRRYEPKQLASLMNLSDELASLNVARYEAWNLDADQSVCRQAILAYNGAVYESLSAATLSIEDILFLQRHLRILSGLYALLKPLDIIQSHRLEMSTPLLTNRGKNLYEFWGDVVTNALNKVLEKNNTDTLVNLASEEYFKVIRPTRLNARVIVPVFEEVKQGKARVVAVHAKKARGWMVRNIAVNRITEPERMKEFNYAGYRFDREASTESHWRFRRKVS